MEDTGDHGKSTRNRATEKIGLKVLLADPRFQAPDRETRKALMTALGVTDESGFGAQSFDAIFTETPMPPLTPATAATHIAAIRLVEMKTTKKPIQNSGLASFFFGATAREYELAQRLGDRFRFAFVVCNGNNDYGCPFAVLLTHDELVRRTQTKRVQFQVNLKSKKAGAKKSACEIVVIGATPPE
jgi:hypothetical protein